MSSTRVTRLLPALLFGALASGALVSAMPAARPVARRAPDETLDIYFIDVEGGQSTLIKTPNGETLLIDAGFASDGTFASRPIDPTEARDPQRILAAAHDAGVSRIDYLMVTHFHGDHDGGVATGAALEPWVCCSSDSFRPAFWPLEQPTESNRRSAQVRRMIEPGSGKRIWGVADGPNLTFQGGSVSRGQRS